MCCVDQFQKCAQFTLSSHFCPNNRGKTITKCCLSQVNGNFYVGTEGGNVFILDLMNFSLSTEVIYWNNATAP